MTVSGPGNPSDRPPLKVVHLCTFDHGGAGKAAHRLHQGLQGLGVESTMLVLVKRGADPTVKLVLPTTPDEGFAAVNQTGESPIWTLSAYRWHCLQTQYPKRQEHIEVFSDAFSDLDLSRIPEIQDADIVNLHWVAAMLDCRRPLAGLRGKPVVWTLHDMSAFTGGCHYAGTCTRYLEECGACPMLGSTEPSDHSREIWRAKAGAYRDLDLHWVTPSRWLAGCAARSSAAGKREVIAIPNGIPLDVFRPCPRKVMTNAMGVAASANIILFGADDVLNVRKGFAHLLEALSHLSSAGPEELVLVCFGSLSAEIKSRLKMRIVTTGPISDENQLAMLYSAADVFVIPSLEDNLPNTVLEAMACGTPVVGFNVGGISEMVEPERTGCLAPPRDSVALADAIRWGLVHGKDQAVRKACRRRVLDHFSQARQATAYLSLYEHLLQSRRGPRPDQGGTLQAETKSRPLPVRGSAGPTQPLSMATVATSLAPSGIDRQRRAVDSWRKAGFHVQAVNYPDEIDRLAPHFPEVEFVAANRRSAPSFRKPYVFIDDLLQALGRSGAGMVGIINSDIVLTDQPSLLEVAAKHAAGALLYGRRFEEADRAMVDDTSYPLGYDYFFFDRALIGDYPTSDFCIGLPWWDYWLPLVPLLKKRPVKRILVPIGRHDAHAINWDGDAYHYLMRHLIARLHSGEIEPKPSAEWTDRVRALVRGLQFTELSRFVVHTIDQGAVALDPWVVDENSVRHYVAICLKEGRIEDAHRVATERRRSHPQDQANRVLLTRAEESLGKRDTAIRELEEVLKEDAGYTDAWKYLAVFRAHAGDPDGAIGALAEYTALQKAGHGHLVNGLGASLRTADAWDRLISLVVLPDSSGRHEEGLTEVMARLPRDSFEVIQVGDEPMVSPLADRDRSAGRGVATGGLDYPDRSSALNLATVKARGRYLVFRGDGLKPERDWLIRGILPLVLDPDTGIVGGKIVGEDRRVTGCGYENGEIIDPAYGCLPQVRYRGLDEQDPRVNRPENVLAVALENLFIERNLFFWLQGFTAGLDHRLGAMDLCRRADLAGKKVLYEPRSVLRQKGGRSVAGDEASAEDERTAKRLFCLIWRTRRSPPDREAVQDPGANKLGVYWASPFLKNDPLAQGMRSLVLNMPDGGLSVKTGMLKSDPGYVARMSEVEFLKWRELFERPVRPAVVIAGTPVCLSGMEDALGGVRRANSDGYYFIGYTAFDGNRLQEPWVSSANAMDEVWVPSRFCAEVFGRSGVDPAKIRIRPFGVDTRRFDPATAKPGEIPSQKRFTFLSVVDWSEWSGWDVFLRAGVRAFRGNRDVRLVICGAPPESLDVPARVSAVLASLGHREPEGPSIVLITKPPSDDELPGLFAAANACVSASRGDGCGLACLQAMSMGLPTIATAYGAARDFLTEKNGYPVDHDLVDLPSSGPAAQAEPAGLLRDNQWAEPRIKALIRAMRSVYQEPTVARGRGALARERVVNRYELRRVVQSLADSIGRIPARAEFQARRSRGQGYLDVTR